MDFMIEFGARTHDLTLTLDGAIDAKGLEDVNDALLADDRYRAGLKILVDLSGVEVDQLTEKVLERAATRVLERDWTRPPRAIALLATGEESAKGLLLWRAQLGGSQSRRGVFTSRDEAIDWLAQQ